MRYCRFYTVTVEPHIAIIDPRTGERVEVWEGFLDPVALIENCMYCVYKIVSIYGINLVQKFLDSHSLDEHGGKKRKPKPKRVRTQNCSHLFSNRLVKQGDISEEAQLAAAIAASLGGAADDSNGAPEIQTTHTQVIQPQETPTQQLTQPAPTKEEPAQVEPPKGIFVGYARKCRSCVARFGKKQNCLNLRI